MPDSEDSLSEKVSKEIYGESALARMKMVGWKKKSAPPPQPAEPAQPAPRKKVEMVLGSEPTDAQKQESDDHRERMRDRAKKRFTSSPEAED